MQVKSNVVLSSYTKDPERTIASAAKLCYSDKEMDALINLDEQAVAPAIKMLLSMGHLSPFEHASFTFGITGVSRTLLAQITRHRIASFSVRSQRYVNEGEFDYIIPPAIESMGKTAVEEYTDQMKTMANWYKNWRAKLIAISDNNAEKANEDARFILPNACETRMFVTMNARELLHFFELRCCNRAQWEIRSVAKQMLQLVRGICPNVFRKAGPSCMTKGVCPEGAKTCGRLEAK